MLKPLISLVVPFFNEEEAILPFHERVSTVLDALPSYHFEIICVDDGSRDNTVRDLVGLARLDKRIVVVELTRNYGKEAAMTAGLEHATGDAAIVMDADLQDPPELIGEMLAKWKEGADMVLAKRIDRSSDGSFKRWSAHWFYKLHNRASKVQLPENVGDFRLLSRDVLEALKELPERQRFMKGLFAWVGFKTAEVEYVRPVRAAGTTKFSPFKLVNLALDGFYSFSTLPIRMWTYIGAVCALLTLCYAGFIVIRTWVHGIDIPGYASLLVVSLFFGSFQLMSLGMLGQYISRIHEEVKQRPIYLVRKVHGQSTDRSL